MQVQTDYESILAAEFGLNPEDALAYECVSIEVIEGEFVYDTVPGALAEYFREEGGWVH